MSLHQLKDGRWIVQYPNREPLPRLKREYFGRGLEGGAKGDLCLSWYITLSTNLRPRDPRSGGLPFSHLCVESLSHFLRQQDLQHRLIRHILAVGQYLDALQ
jgi:hypothetical protein